MSCLTLKIDRLSYAVLNIGAPCNNTKLRSNQTCAYESAKLCALVRTCQRLLLAYVLMCQCVVCAYVPTCLVCLRANVPCVLKCSSVNVPCMLTCLRTNVPRVPCLTWFAWERDCLTWLVNSFDANLFILFATVIEVVDTDDKVWQFNEYFS